MNDAHGLTAQNLLYALPQVLQEDANTQALAAAVAEILAAQPQEIDRLRIYSRIGELPEELLDVLAYDFKVDWWDGDYTLEEKRQTLQDSWRVHRMLGTKAAMETAIAAVYPGTKIIEWFEYGGQPYCFQLRVNVGLGDITSERHSRIIDRVGYYKNLRSHLDAVRYVFAEAVAENAESIFFHAAAFRMALKALPSALPRAKLAVRGYQALNSGQVTGRVSARVLPDTGGMNNGNSLRLCGVTFQTPSPTLLQPPAAKRVRIRGAAVHSCETLQVTLTQYTLWYLDGVIPLDGSRKLNAGTTKEVL